MEKVIRPIQNDLARDVNQAKSHKVQQAEAPKQPTPPPQTRKSLDGDEVVLSKQAQDLQRLQRAVDAAPDTRALTVAQLRQQVQNGTYQVPDDLLADRILKAFGIG